MEKKYSPFSGYVMVTIEIILLAFVIFGFMRGLIVYSVIALVAFIFISI